MQVQKILSAMTLALLLSACGQSHSPVTAAANTAGIQAQGVEEDDNTPPAGVGKAAADLHLAPPVLGQPGLPTDARLGETVVLPGPQVRAQGLGTQGLGAQGVGSQGLGTQGLASNLQTNKVALRVLVLSSGAGDYGVGMAQAMLQEAGVPYDVLDASSASLTADVLVDASGVGRYQGIVLTSSALSVANPDGTFVSALDSGEWADLFAYEAAYKVRQLALYGYPSSVPEDYGLRPVSGAEGSTTTLTPSSAGRAVFNDLTATTIPVNYAYSYPAALVKVPNVTTQPLLTNSSGRILAATSTSADGRERLLLTSAQSPYLLHSQLLGYGLVQWLTKGVHLGENRRFLQVDIDDWFSSGTHLNASTLQPYSTEFRLSASDALSVRWQQLGLRAEYPVAQNFRYALVFNGGNADQRALESCFPLGKLLGDPLTSVSRCMARDFDWVNHTKDHLRMDVMDYGTAYSQIADNFAIGRKLGLNVSQKSLVTGEQSGLGYMDPADDGSHNADNTVNPKQDLGLGYSNVNMLGAAVDSGSRYVASNHSVASNWDASCPVCGVVHPLNSNIFLVPRWPNNVAYYATNPAEEVAFYNSVYAPGGTRPTWDHALTYSEVLDKETDIALNHLLDGGAFPHYMHQGNLRQYALGKSLATDWVRALLNKYSKYSTLPLNTLKWNDLGAYMERRTREEKAKTAGTLSAVWNRSGNMVTLNSTAGSVPATLTGGTAGNQYGAYRVVTGDIGGVVTVPVSPK